MVTLIWGNKAQEDIVFREELEAMRNHLSSFKIIHVLSQEEWEGETGFIDQKLLKRHIEDFQKPEFFICGPPPMMAMVKESLIGLGVDRGRIHDERFSLR
jgi:3-phenylpropionate/trans-cinnamate dioxygenase ferredoxin reductase subunit